jgi:hypothetical protein
MFDNSLFDNSFGFFRQLKNRSFLGPFFVHVTGNLKTKLCWINVLFNFFPYMILVEQNINQT